MSPLQKKSKKYPQKKIVKESNFNPSDNAQKTHFAYCWCTCLHCHNCGKKNIKTDKAEEPFLLKDTIRGFKKFTSKIIIAQIQNEPESRREWMLKLFEEQAEPSKRHKYYKF